MKDRLKELSDYEKEIDQLKGFMKAIDDYHVVADVYRSYFPFLKKKVAYSFLRIFKKKEDIIIDIPDKIMGLIQVESIKWVKELERSQKNLLKRMASEE